MPVADSKPAEPLAAPSRYAPLVAILAAFAGGILADRYFPRPVTVWWIAAVIVWLVWLLAWLLRKDRIAAVLLLVGIGATGACWHHVRWFTTRSDEIGRFAQEEAQPVCLEAIALAAPRWSPAPPPNPMQTMPRRDHTHVQLEVLRVRDAAVWRPISGKTRLTVDGRLNHVRAGDGVRILAKLRKPAPPGNPGDFDYRQFLRTHGQHCHVATGHPECVTVISAGSPWSMNRLTGDVRERFNNLLWRHVSQARAGLASAILLGSREQLDRERTEAFFTTGTIHLLAISGLHVGMLASVFWLMGRIGMLSRRKTLLAATVFVLLYSLLIGARPPVVRATILIVTLCGARMIGRPAFSFNTLAIAAIFVLVLNPAWLVQAGAQLSFLAVATLSVCAPLLMRRPIQDPLARLIANTRPWPVRFGKRAANVVWRLGLASTLIWLVALPLVLYRFHLLSPVAVVLNPVLMFPIGIALFAGFAVLMLGSSLPAAGEICGWACDRSLWFIESCIQFAQPISGSHYWLPGPQLWWVIGFYAGLAVFVGVPQVRPPRRWCAAILAAWVAVGLATSSTARHQFSQHDADELTCTFLAVGHGTSVVLELPGGRTLLYDAGSLASPTAGARSIAAVLWSRGITHLDAVILSHADADHYNAFPELLKRISVGVVYVSPVMFEDAVWEEDGPHSLLVLQQEIENAGVPIRHLSMGDRLRTLGDVRLEILHPPRKGVLATPRNKDNANSIVLLVEYAGRRILLPGDLVSPGMDDMLAEDPIDCDVVMAPHHGSLGSAPQQFMAWTTAEAVVISGGSHHGANAATDIFQDNGAQVFHTANDGAVRVRIDHQECQVRAWRRDPW